VYMLVNLFPISVSHTWGAVHALSAGNNTATIFLNSSI
jgi:hypothetical protein